MSMPSFPPNGADMTREEALTMIIASIAMEELALSHILNAEGEKLQYILGTLPGASPCTCPQDVLAVNKSVAALVEAVTQNQMLLKNKLEKVLEFCPPPPPPCKPEPAPCPPPCPPQGSDPCPAPCPDPCKTRSCEKSSLQLSVQRERMIWKPDCRLPWRSCSCSGKDICWEGRTPVRVQLKPGKAYMVQYTLNACAVGPAEGTGAICLRQSPGGAFTDALPLRFSMECLTHGSQTLHQAVILHPHMNGGGVSDLSLVLNAETSLCVERAVMDVIEL